MPQQLKSFNVSRRVARTAKPNQQIHSIALFVVEGLLNIMGTTTEPPPAYHTRLSQTNPASVDLSPLLLLCHVLLPDKYTSIFKPNLQNSNHAQTPTEPCHIPASSTLINKATRYTMSRPACFLPGRQRNPLLSVKISIPDCNISQGLPPAKPHSAVSCNGTGFLTSRGGLLLAYYPNWLQERCLYRRHSLK